MIRGDCKREQGQGLEWIPSERDCKREPRRGSKDKG